MRGRAGGALPWLMATERQDNGPQDTAAPCPWLPFLWIIAASALAHLWCLGSQFYMDDMLGHPGQRGDPRRSVLAESCRTPGPRLGYVIQYRLFGMSPVAFHAVNWLLHTAVACVLFGFGRDFLRGRAPGRGGVVRRVVVCGASAGERDSELCADPGSRVGDLVFPARLMGAAAFPAGRRMAESVMDGAGHHRRDHVERPGIVSRADDDRCRRPRLHDAGALAPAPPPRSGGWPARFC